MLPTTEKPTQAGPASGLAVIAGSGFCFPNGAIAVCDKNGQQIPELQVGWPVLWARHAVASGFDPVGTVFETSAGKIRIFKTDEDFNWEIL